MHGTRSIHTPVEFIHIFVWQWMEMIHFCLLMGYTRMLKSSSARRVHCEWSRANWVFVFLFFIRDFYDLEVIVVIFITGHCARLYFCETIKCFREFWAMRTYFHSNDRKTLILWKFDRTFLNQNSSTMEKYCYSCCLDRVRSKSRKKTAKSHLVKAAWCSNL